MNILPKKRWHVRTKDNIARVRRDEAKATEEEIERQRRIQLAEQEARTAILREQARTLHGESSSAIAVPVSSETNKSDDVLRNLNLFPELADGQKSWGANKEHEAEKKEEQEKYEKSIGLLTYLGQTSLENKEQPWYYKAPKDRHIANSDSKDEVKSKSKSFLDPLKDMRAYLKMMGDKSPKKRNDRLKPKDVNSVVEKSFKKKAKKSARKSSKKKKKGHKHGKHKHKRKDSSGSSEAESAEETTDGTKVQMLNRLRMERIRREKEESAKASRLLARIETGTEDASECQAQVVPPADGEQGYNSQFNPHLVRKRKR